ncbi:MAG: ASCH domain-containing protein [Candidatus Pacearchaeota archaeon]
MKLVKDPFRRVQRGEKVIEVRLYDEQRQKVEIGDEIEILNYHNREESVLVEVIGLSRFRNFYDLYSAFDPSKFGHTEGTKPEEQAENDRQHYSREDEEKYGVLGIHIRLKG